MPIANNTVLEPLAAKAPAPSRPLDPVHQAIVDERKADGGRRGRPSNRPTRDALVALQYGKMQGLQRHVLDRLEKAILNEDDPLHEMVVEKLMQRVVPQAFWDALGKQEFATEEDRKAPPSVTIIIGNQAGAAPPAEIVSEQ